MVSKDIVTKIDEACTMLQAIHAEITIDRVLDYLGVADPSSNLVERCSWPLIREIVAKIEYERRNR